MIELIVAMIILAIVLAVFVRALLGGFGAAAVTMTTRKAEAIVAHATDQMGDDLRSARAHERNFDKIREPLQLRKAVMSGETINDPVTAAPLDVADVKVATATSFSFLSNLVVEPAGSPTVAECVYYRVESGGGYWWMARYVSPYAASCSPSGTMSLVVKQQLGAAPTAVFSYTLVCNRNGVNGRTCNGAVPSPTPPLIGPCAPGTATAVSGTALNWITSVAFDLSALVERAEYTARGRLRGKVGLRTRQNHDYLYALGCEI